MVKASSSSKSTKVSVQGKNETTNVTVPSKEAIKYTNVQSNSASLFAQQANAYATDAARNANRAKVWAEGSDTEVAELGGEHSSKGWVEQAKNYTKEVQNIQDALLSNTAVATVFNHMDALLDLKENKDELLEIRDDVETAAQTTTEQANRAEIYTEQISQFAEETQHNANMAATSAGMAYNYLETATEQANIATENAEIAIVQATNALTSEKNAKTSETNTLTYSNSANASSTIAKEQANISTEKAQESADYSELSKQWAMSETLVDNIDYSSKHYATVAKEEANKAESYRGQVSQHAEEAQYYANMASASSSSAYEYLEATTEQANISTTNAEISITQASNALKSAENATLSEANAKESENKAKTSETNALNSANVATQQAQIAKDEVAKISTVYKYAGSVATFNDLPTTANTGDVYDTQETGMNYAWNGTEWDELGGTFDVSWESLTGNISDNTALQTALDGKVSDVQTNGTSIVVNGVANIPVASSTTFGLVRPVNANGIYASSSGTLNLYQVSDDTIKKKSSACAVLVNKIDLAVKTGVTTNTITLTDEEKTKAKNWLGFASSEDIPNTSNFITMEEVESKGYLTEVPDEYVTDTELSAYSYDKATVESKIADAVAGVVHLDNAETISGAKTFTQPIKIQNGAGTGSLIVGGDVNAGTVTNGVRKLARIAVPTYNNKDLMATLLGFDSNGDDALHIKNRFYDAISFGGQTKITNATSPMSLGFCVAKTRNGTAASDKIYTLEMDSTEARFNVQPNYNGVNLATTVDITNALNGYAKLTDIPDSSSFATKEELNDKQDTLTAGENIAIENNVISAKSGSMPIGTIIPVNASTNYVPECCLSCDGATYSRSQFEDFCNNYLGGKEPLLSVCTLAEYEAEVATYGQCSKFAADRITKIGFEKISTSATININFEQFRVLFPDGVVLKFVFNGSSWTLDGKVVNLDDYALSANGMPTKNDYFTVGYWFGYVNTFRVPLINKVLTDIADSVGVRGNGTAIGLTDGTNNGGLYLYTPSSTSTLRADNEVYRSVVGTSASNTTSGLTSGAIALTNEAEYSGIIADTTNAKTYSELRYFVVVANGQINQSMMDWNAWASGLQSKANADLSNCTRPYIVETSDKSILPSWYRVWSDGWCEQGGEVTVTSETNMIPVTFIKSYVKEPSLVTSVSSSLSYSSSTTSANVNTVVMRAGTTCLLSTTGFNFCHLRENKNDGAGTAHWNAKGYIK